MAYGLSEITQNGVDYRINDPNITNEFSASTAYSSGTYVNYNGLLYQFTTDHPAGAWDANHVSAVKVGDEIADLNGALDFENSLVLAFEHGSLADGADNNYRSGSRARTKKHRFNMNLKFSVKDPNGNAAFVVNYYNADGTLKNATAWIKSAVIQKNETFRVLISLNPNTNISATIAQMLEAFEYSFLFASSDLDPLSPVNFENGSFNGNTGETTSYNAEKRLRSNTLQYAYSNVHIVKTNASIKMEIYFYTKAGTFINATDYLDEITIPSGYYYKILLISTVPIYADAVGSILEWYDKAPNIVDVAMVENGSINTNNGENTDYNKEKRLRTKEIAFADKGFFLKKISGSNLNWSEILYYKEDGTYIGVSDDEYIKAGSYYRLVFDYKANIYAKYLNESIIVVPFLQANSEIAYIDGVNGNDEYNGTYVAPFKTLNAAISAGYKRLMVRGGVYHEKIDMHDDSLEINIWEDVTGAVGNLNREKITLINGTEVTPDAGENGIYTAPYTVDPGTNFYKVFVEQSLTPTSEGSYGIEYNALFVGNTKNNNKAKRMKPVLTLTEVQAESGTFTYNNGSIVFRPSDDDLETKYYVIDDSAENIISLLKMNNVKLNSMRIVGAYGTCAQFKRCQNVEVVDCDFLHSAKESDVRVLGGNAKFIGCHSCAASIDGFGIGGFSYTEFINCTAFNNGDDGISHHSGCEGRIIGGEYAGNGSGGITPSFGATIEIADTITHDNGEGLQFLGLNPSQHGETIRRTCTVHNALSFDNNDDIYSEWYNLVFVNCIYKTKNIKSTSVLTEYNSTVLS